MITFQSVFFFDDLFKRIDTVNMAEFLDKEGLQVLVDDLKKRYILKGFPLFDASGSYTDQNVGAFIDLPFIFIKNVRIEFDPGMWWFFVYKEPGTISICPLNVDEDIYFTNNIENLFGTNWEDASNGSSYFRLTFRRCSKTCRKLTEHLSKFAASDSEYGNVYYSLFVSSKLYDGLKANDPNFAAIADPSKYASTNAHAQALADYLKPYTDGTINNWGDSDVVVEPGIELFSITTDDTLFRQYLARPAEISVANVTNKLNA